jgi:peptidoglycan/xylan/chitin deacetylase (PgdA/CDA1 family)
VDVRRSGLVVLAVLLAGCAVSPPPGSFATTPLPTGVVTVNPTGGESTTPASSPTSSAPSAPASSPTSSGSPTAPQPTTCAKPASGFVRVAPGKGKTVALTFDDGPGPADLAIVPILDRYGVHATFFETGAHAAASPAIVKLLAAHGELIADHSWDHQYPSRVAGGWTQGYLHGQFQSTNRELRTLTGAPVCFVRPPGGFQQNVVAAAAKLGMTAALWSVDSLDWRQPSRTTAAATAAIVANATTTGGRRHPVVLMHSAKASHESDLLVSPFRGNTVAALPAVIEWYRSHGYRFVTLGGAA